MSSKSASGDARLAGRLHRKVFPVADGSLFMLYATAILGTTGVDERRSVLCLPAAGVHAQHSSFEADVRARAIPRTRFRVTLSFRHRRAASPWPSCGFATSSRAASMVLMASAITMLAARCARTASSCAMLRPPRPAQRVEVLHAHASWSIR